MGTPSDQRRRARRPRPGKRERARVKKRRRCITSRWTDTPGHAPVTAHAQGRSEEVARGGVLTESVESVERVSGDRPIMPGNRISKAACLSGGWCGWTPVGAVDRQRRESRRVAKWGTRRRSRRQPERRPRVFPARGRQQPRGARDVTIAHSQMVRHRLDTEQPDPGRRRTSPDRSCEPEVCPLSAALDVHPDASRRALRGALAAVRVDAGEGRASGLHQRASELR